MTTAFQWVIDNAESISIDRMKNVSTVTSRNGTVRSVGRAGQPWKFTVALPTGPKWSAVRQEISKIEALDRVTVGQIQINNAGHSWLVEYQGNAADDTAMTASWTTGNTITLTGGQATSGYNFRSGDIIQLGASGACYTVAADVAYNSNTVTLHRPLVDAAGAGTLRVGDDCVWSVLCTQFPNWELVARDAVGWSGSFVFIEDLT